MIYIYIYLQIQTVNFQSRCYYQHLSVPAKNARIPRFPRFLCIFSITHKPFIHDVAIYNHTLAELLTRTLASKLACETGFF